MKSNLLKVGLVGSVVTAICCFTPILVVLMGAAGLAAWTGKLDLVLFPLPLSYLTAKMHISVYLIP